MLCGIFRLNLLWEKGTLVLEPQNADYIPKDASEQEIWDQIEKDLTFAMENLPEAWDAADLGRATKGAAKALLGKAYMQQHKYDRAKEQLQWLIDREGSLYGLLDNREDNFTDLNENNQEGIFEIQFDDQNKGAQAMMPVWPLVSSVLSFMHPVALMVRVGAMVKRVVG